MKTKLLNLIKFAHRWAGLSVGWFLFLIFLTGSISIFDREIDLWMQPELYAFSQPEAVSLQALKQFYTQWQLTQDYPKNIIILPYDRNPVIRVMHYQDKILQGNAVDPVKGTLINLKHTGGGYFVDTLHKNLFLGPVHGKPFVLFIDSIFILVLVTGLPIHFFQFSKTFLFINKNKKSRFSARFPYTFRRFHLSIFTRNLFKLSTSYNSYVFIS